MSSQISEENQITYDQIIEHLANNTALPSLAQHYLRDLFQQTDYIPHELTYNLKSDNRIIRKIDAADELPQTVFRGFYFQLLKLCYEMYDEQSSKNYIQILKSIVFDNALLENQQSQKYLKHIAQFFILMENGQEQDYALFEEILAEYHEIDQALIHVFSFILQSQSHLGQDSDIETILNELCDFFQIGLISNHPFYQFEESEIYLFIQDDKAVYLVYQQQDVQEISHLSSSKRSEQRSEQRGNSHLSKPQSNNGQSQVRQVEQIHKSNTAYFNQPPLTERKQVVQLTFQQRIQQLSRPLSKASAKSTKNKPQMQDLQRQAEENRLFTNNSNKTTNKPNNPFSPTYPSASSQNNFFSPIRDMQSKQPSNERRGEQTPVQYAINSYYDGLYGDIPHNTSTHLNSSKNDTIMNIFGDMLKSVKFQNSMAEDITKGKKNTTERTQKILESQQEFEQQSSSDQIPTFKKINRVDMTHMIDRAKSVKSVNEHISELNSGSIIVSKINEENAITAQVATSNKQIPSIDSNNEKIAQKPQAKLQDNYKMFENAYEHRDIANFDDEDTIFYKPKKSQLKVISEVTASKQTITHRNSDKLDDSKGSIYRQFSDTRILKLLKQPYKTKVQLMRNRFKGQHFNL